MSYTKRERTDSNQGRLFKREAHIVDGASLYCY